MLRLLHVALLGAFLLFLACRSASSGHSSAPAMPRRPNIVFIMTDDHAGQAISCFGSNLIQTPNIDRIAEQGARFTNSFVTNSICAPSRAVLLTGMYSHLNGLRDNRDQFDGSRLTFPKLLQQAGYQTSLVGKWHLKTDPTGFDYWNVLIDQGEYYNPIMIENGDTIRHTGYVTDIITDLALSYLSGRDPAKPFCLLYHHKAPHRNWMPDPKHWTGFLGKSFPLPANFYDDYATRSAAASGQDMRIADMFLSYDLKLLPADYDRETGTGGSARFDGERSWLATLDRMTPEQRRAWEDAYAPVRRDFREKKRTGRELLEWKYQRYMQDYLACVASVDDNVGRLLDYLDEQGLTENTIVIYTSDQGFYLGEHGWYDKRFMYEESLRMPLVMRYPPGIRPGTVIDQMVLNLDFAPTILDYAGIRAPADMQGASFRPLAHGENLPDWRTSMYYHYYEYPHGWHRVRKHEGVRTEHYKLIHFYDDIDAWEMYDLRNDAPEMVNLAGDAAYARVKDTLMAELERLKKVYQVPPIDP